MIMSHSKLSILTVFAILALVAVASAALPVSVTATLKHPAPYINTSPYWNVDITAGGNEALPNGMYDGYCANGNAYMQVQTAFNIYDSRFPATFPGGINTADWNRINYVLNNKQGADKITLQWVYWYYSGGYMFTEPAYDTVKYAAILADADANGGSFVPTVAGQHYAVIFWNPEQVQLAFIEAIVPTTPGPNPVPEFPSLALPIAMMLGLVFIVHVVKGREK
jgi:hypothetical protein